jgi:hypothetical protein
MTPTSNAQVRHKQMTEDYNERLVRDFFEEGCVGHI